MSIRMVVGGGRRRSRGVFGYHLKLRRLGPLSIYPDLDLSFTHASFFFSFSPPLYSLLHYGIEVRTLDLDTTPPPVVLGVFGTRGGPS